MQVTVLRCTNTKCWILHKLLKQLKRISSAFANLLINAILCIFIQELLGYFVHLLTNVCSLSFHGLLLLHVHVSVCNKHTVSSTVDVTPSAQSPGISPSSSHDLLSSQEYPDRKGDIGELFLLASYR